MGFLVGTTIEIMIRPATAGRIMGLASTWASSPPCLIECNSHGIRDREVIGAARGAFRGPTAIRAGAYQKFDVKSGSFQENAYALPRSMNALKTSGFFFLSHISE